MKEWYSVRIHISTYQDLVSIKADLEKKHKRFVTFDEVIKWLMEKKEEVMTL